MFLAFALFGCDPLEDEINQVNDDFAYVEDIVITLTDDDYEIADDACDCAGFGSFSSEDDAKVGIAAVLAANYPALGEGSSAIVTYDRFNGSSPDLRGTYTEFTVPDADYDLFHGFDGFDNFGNPDQEVVDYVNWKGFTGEDGDYMDVTFDYFQGGFFPGAVSRIVYTVAYGWQYAWILTDEVYDFFGESSSCFGVPDFSFDDEASEKLHIYLNEFMSIFAEEGDKLVVQFNYDNGDDCNDDIAEGPIVDPTEQDVILYIYDGNEWLIYGDAFQTTQATISFGHDGIVWVPDNTIKYSLASDDYAAIAAAYEATNGGGSASMASFGNYDLSLWSSDQIFDSITARLLDISGIMKVDGQKYLVSYSTWEPGAGTGTVHVIYEGGAFVLVE